MLHVRCPGLFVGLNVSWEGLLACPARGAAKKLQVVRGVSDRTSQTDDLEGVKPKSGGLSSFLALLEKL